MPYPSEASPPAPGFDVIARALAVVSLSDLALVHVIDLPDTLDATPLIGAGYFVLIAAALAIGVALMIRPHWVAWAAAGLLSAATMGAYILTRTVSGFLGDHEDVGNWRCALGLAALSLETVLIALAVAHAPRRPAFAPAAPNATANSLPTYSSAR